MFYMDDVNDADQEEDETGSRGEEDEEAEGGPVPALPRNFSLGRTRKQISTSIHMLVPVRDY
jgi:hypothetical protein